MATMGEMLRASDIPNVEVVVPITTVLVLEAIRPSNPKRRKEDHGRDREKSSRRHGERSSSGRSPKRGRVAGLSWMSQPSRCNQHWS